MCVAIVLSSYNGEKYIGEQIDSIIAQDCTDWRLYVFDDGSSDGTEGIVREKMKLVPGRIEFARNARNLGATKSFLNGLFSVYDRFPMIKYFMFCDQDDHWNEDKLSVSLGAMQGKEPSLAFTDCIVADEELRRISHSFMKRSGYDLKRTDLAGLLMENKCIGCTCIMNRELVKLLRENTEPEMKSIRYHDWWAALAAAAFGNVIFVPECTMLYRQHGKNAVGVAKKTDYVKDRAGDVVKRRKALDDTFLQGKAFYSCFGTLLRGKNREITEAFLTMTESKGYKKRLTCIHYGFLKSGILRNIGLMISL